MCIRIKINKKLYSGYSIGKYLSNVLGSDKHLCVNEGNYLFTLQVRQDVKGRQLNYWQIK